MVAVLVSLFSLYARQTSLGHWQVDEFRYFTDQRALEWRAYIQRLYTSPRPLSEAFIYGYGTMVLAFKRDFIPQVLLAVWAGSLLLTIAAAWSGLRRSPVRGLAAVVLGLAPMIFILQIGPVTELFFWPVATLAYVPTAASITALLFLLDAEPGPARQRCCGAALLTAATCHEVGAAFALVFAATASVFVLTRATTESRGAVLWLLIPAGAGLCVMLGLVLFRSRFVDLGADTQPYTGLLLASAGAAAWQLLTDIVTTANWPHDPAGGLAAIVQKSMFAVGFAAIWLQCSPVRPNRWHAAMAIGLAGAGYFSLLAAYYHYGQLCCERHAGMRQWLVELGFILAAMAALANRTQMAKWCGPLLVAVSLMPLIKQIPEIRTDLGLIQIAQDARMRTWASGLAAGPQMQFYMPPDSGAMLIHGTSLPVKTFYLDTDAGLNDLVDSIGAFFGKTVITVCQPWQTHQSFLINGTFIPACPPHDGPPDIVFDTAPQ